MIRILIASDLQQDQFTHSNGPVELGRGPKRDVERYFILDRFASRDQLLIEEVGNGKVRVSNLGKDVTLEQGKMLASGETQELFLPARITFGNTTIVKIASESPAFDATMSIHTIAQPTQRTFPIQSAINSLGESPSAETLTKWFETLLTVQQAAAGSREFYTQTANAVVDLVGLDRALVLLRNDRSWTPAATAPAVQTEDKIQFSETVLRQVVDQRRTYFQSLDHMPAVQSLMGIEAVVASPIFDRKQSVVGAVYASRDISQPGANSGITPLEAQLVQILAGVVSIGLARVESEAEAAQNRVQLEQFCAPSIVHALENNPDLLDGTHRDVTIMFCDLRDFSRLSETLETESLYRLLSDFMDHLTDQIIAHEGVVIDYHGDAIAAMWNAPTKQPNHAAMACRAAQGMIREMDTVNEKWARQLDTPLRIGIGINTGNAQVGNAGSRRRIKYGPRGTAANIASRVEGATKQFDLPILITSATRAGLPDTFSVRRLCRSRLVGMADEVTLYELCAESPDDDWLQFRTRYEKALALSDSQALGQARDLLDSLISESDKGADVAAQLMRQKIADCLTAGHCEFNPIIQLTAK